ncbi:hypothetical protein [Pseudomonas anguilliseptica]|uniref:hypothetical protein n=1 Tax=Pseudomonas anguilliseptica TaxID=53406 RepID=UPI00325ADFC7
MSRWTLLVACLLAGCETSMTRAPVEIDQLLMQSCPDLPQVPVAEDGTGDPGELALIDVATAGLYLECQRRHKGLVEAVKTRHKSAGSSNSQ